MIRRSCSVCGNTDQKVKVCGTCRGVGYCSRECQKLDWYRHKKECKPESFDHNAELSKWIKEITNDETIMKIIRIFANTFAKKHPYMGIVIVPPSTKNPDLILRCIDGRVGNPKELPNYDSNSVYCLFSLSGNCSSEAVNWIYLPLEPQIHYPTDIDYVEINVKTKTVTILFSNGKILIENV